MITKRQLIKAFKTDPSLTEEQRARIVRFLRFRPRLANYIVDEVNIHALEENVVTLDSSEADIDKIMEGRDWKGFFEALLPFLLAIFKFFGLQGV